MEVGHIFMYPPHWEKRGMSNFFDFLYWLGDRGVKGQKNWSEVPKMTFFQIFSGTLCPSRASLGAFESPKNALFFDTKLTRFHFFIFEKN